MDLIFFGKMSFGRRNSVMSVDKILQGEDSVKASGYQSLHGFWFMLAGSCLRDPAFGSGWILIHVGCLVFERVCIDSHWFL